MFNMLIGNYFFREGTMLHSSRRILISFMCVLFSSGLALYASEPIHITINNFVLFTFTEDFYGIQYNKNAYNDTTSLNKLEKLDLKWLRLWAYPEDFHPEPGVWEWTTLDQQINEVHDLGYEIVLCLFQSHDWFTGTPENGWWNNDTAVAEWRITARELALRYQDRVKMFLMFDEVNYLSPNLDDYMTFKQCAELYVAAATEIKNVNPDLFCGGPSGYGGWENGHWGNYVIQEPGGSDLLDFISVNQFITWDPEESDADVMDHTIWYEEGPNKIRDMMGDNSPDMLVLDAYNVNGLWQYQGELWTDPRNTNLFGGIYHAAAKLHSAKGNYDITLHWETLGGYGVLRWYPDFEENPPYYCWRFLIETADLTAGSILIDAQSTEVARDAQHMSPINVNSYHVQPFAIKNADGNVRIILINKYDESKTLTVHTPENMNHYKRYRFDSDRIETSMDMLDCSAVEDSASITCPPMSVTVLRYGPEAAVTISDVSSPEIFYLGQNYPNPFNAGTVIPYCLIRDEMVEISIYNHRGEKVQTLLHRTQQAGAHKLFWNAEGYPSGIYLCKIQSEDGLAVKKMQLVK